MLNWQLIVSAFAAIFLAELGDNTQLAAITLAASSNRPVRVFIGATTALAAVTLIGVVVGGALSTALPLALVRKIGACAFVVIGIAMLFDWL
jgi:putative Ca2+/H+ antiporter (TMEM165/GDT1 family)